MNLRSMFGIAGVKLAYSTDNLPVENFPLPGRVTLLYDGIEKPDIKSGDSLKSGQKLAAGFHSTVTGKIISISDIAWLEGQVIKAIEVETTADEWIKESGGFDFINYGPDALFERLNDLGFGKWKVYPAETAVVNCVDSDLLVCSAGQVIRQNSDKLQTGINLLKHITGAKRVIIAVVQKDAASAGTIARGNAEVLIIKPIYPCGAPELAAGFAGDHGACVIAAETLCAIVDGISEGRPFCEKIVTLIDKSGKPVKNLRVRIGTHISEILKSNNITVENNEKLIIGGPMKGVAVYSADFPVTASTDAIMIQQAGNVACFEDSPCINCGRCVHVCPRKIQINLLARYSEFGLFEYCRALDIEYCIECGMCAYVCTARRPLVQYVQYAKKELKKITLMQNIKEEEQ